MTITANKAKGIAATVLFHILMVLLLIMFGFNIPFPLPAEEGIIINFGNSDEGMGLEEPAIGEQAISNPAGYPTMQEDESPLTQDYEEAPALPVKKDESKKKVVEPTEKTNPASSTDKVAPSTTAATPEVEKPREANAKALFPGQKINGGQTGVEGVTGKPGNQGSLEGSASSTNRTGGATGGGGDGQNGIITNLNGRSALLLPKPDYPKQKEGRVVVEVTVDNHGNVTKAIAGIKGSTTLDTDLLKAAEKAALSAKFDVSSNAPSFQVGTITYIFRLN